MARSGAGWSPIPALVLTLCLGAAPLGAQAPAGKRYAVLVGVREYSHARLPNLKYTENDVEELGKILSARRAGFAKVILLSTTRGEANRNARPTADNVRAALKGLLAQVTKRDTVLVALAGHGVQMRVADRKDKTRQTPESFFCPADARLDTPDTLIGLRDLVKQLEASGAGVKLLLVDACRNDPKLGRGVDVDSVPRPPKGTAALFSCSSGQRAYETDKLGGGHGVFFHFVLEGLRGKAGNKEHDVTWDSLTEYVKQQVSRQVPKLIGDGARQEPQVVADLVGESPLLLRLKPGRQALKRGRELLAAHRYDDAGATLSEAIRQAPDEPLAYVYRASVSVHRRKWDRALDDCNQAVKLGPDLALAYALRARVRAAHGDQEAARDDVREALRRNAKLSVAYQAQGDIASSGGDHSAAVKEYGIAIGLAPDDDAAPYVDRAGAYAKLGSYDLALEDYAAAMRRDPHYPRAYRDLGIARIRQKSFERAIEDLNAAARLDPHDDAGFFWRGVAHYRLKKYEKATNDYSRALRLNPGDALSWANRGMVHHVLGKSDLALADLGEAIRRNPGYVKAYCERGVCYSQLSRYEQAIADFTQAIRRNPKCVRAYRERGLARHKQRKYSKAVADSTRAIDLQPGNARLYADRAQAFRGKGDQGRARADRAAARRLGRVRRPAP
jgi:tetratricopeptide (TPR) repeat protein